MWLRIPVELLAFNQGTGSGGSDGGGTGSGTGNSGGTGGSGGTSGQGAGGGSGDGSGSGDDPAKATIDPNSKEFKDAVAAAVEQTVQDRLQRDRQQREADTERQKREAAAQALKDNQKFEELAKTRETQLNDATAQLTAVTTERDNLQVRVKESDAAIQKILTAQTKDLPPHIMTLLGKLTPAEQLTYLADNAEAIRKGSTQAVPNHGTGSSAGTGSGTGGSGTGVTGVAGALTSYIGATYGQQSKDGK